MNRWTHGGKSALLIAAFACGIVTPIGSQAPARAPSAVAPAKGAWAVVRTPWGDPDLQGTWTKDDYIGVPIQRTTELGNKLFLTEQEWNDRAAQQKQQAAKAAQSATPPAGGGGCRAFRAGGRGARRGLVPSPSRD